MPTIIFDIEKVKNLEKDFRESISYTLLMLPQKVNWNSQKQIITFFKNEFGLELKDTKIATLAGQQSAHEHDPELHDVLTGALQYMKLKATLNNYILCILRHLDGDRLELRDVNGVWMFPNKQPLPRNLEIWACVKSYSADLFPLMQAITGE